MPAESRVLVVDNADSFTFNLVDALAVLGAEVDVFRNDAGAERLLNHATRTGADLIVLSPGPGTPDDAGCCLALVHQALSVVPLLGVCLGHQVIVQALGGEIAPVGTIVHGKRSRIRHDGHGLFAGMPAELDVGRYHSLAARRVPESLEVIARDGELVMAVAHRALPAYGVQFHPESVLTTLGQTVLANALTLARAANDRSAIRSAPDRG